MLRFDQSSVILPWAGLNSDRPMPVSAYCLAISEWQPAQVPGATYLANEVSSLDVDTGLVSVAGHNHTKVAPMTSKVEPTSAVLRCGDENTWLETVFSSFVYRWQALQHPQRGLTITQQIDNIPAHVVLAPFALFARAGVT